MIKAILTQQGNDISLEYETLEEIEELIKVVGSGQEIESLTVMIGLAKPKEEED